MDLAISGFKGGVGKTTTALHIAYFVSQRFPDQSVLVVDYDSKNRTALNHARAAEAKNKPFPFQVVSDGEGIGMARKFKHVIYDLPGSPEENKLSDICKGVDMMILPSGINDRQNLEPILDVIPDLDPKKYRVLVTLAPPRPQMDGDNSRQFFIDMNIPVLQTIVRQKKVYNHAANDGKLVTVGQYDDVTDEILKILGLI